MNEKYSNFLKLSKKNDGVFYLGHASILASISGTKILFDPILLSSPYSDAWTFYPEQINDPRFYEVDCVVVSHIHQDHYDVEFLKKIDGHIPIVIVGGRPSFEADLEANGIKNVKIVNPEVISEILDGIFIFGVNHESNGIDSSCIVFNNNFSVYHGNDNFLTEESLNKFNKIGVKINVACIPYAYINWYPFLLEYDPEEIHLKECESTRLVEMYMNDCINSTTILNPEIVIPFGANLLLDDGNAFSDINLAVKTPLEFVDYMNHYYPELSGVITAMHAGDYCYKSNGLMFSAVDEALVSSVYRISADNYLKNRALLPKDLNFKEVDIEKFVENLNLKLSKCNLIEDQVIRMDLNYLEKKILIEIDCKKRFARLVNKFTTDTNFHHFKLDHIASGYWLSGKRFEEIIGMRRFKLRRVPNIYSKDIIKIATTII